jgi:hypothetical protein
MNKVSTSSFHAEPIVDERVNESGAKKSRLKTPILNSGQAKKNRYGPAVSVDTNRAAESDSVGACEVYTSESCRRLSLDSRARKVTVSNLQSGEHRGGTLLPISLVGTLREKENR